MARHKEVGEQIYMGKIIDFIFPMMDEPSKAETEEENERRSSVEKVIMDYQFRDGEAELMLKISDEYEKRENARLHEVESKATVFIGTFSVAVTILMSLLKDFVSEFSSVILLTSSVGFRMAMSILLVVAIFYLCFAIIYSVNTLQREKFSVLGVKETLNAGEHASIVIGINKERDWKDITANNDDKKAEIARKKFLYTYRNEKVINRKVDYMTRAQRFFKHAVIVLIIMISLLLAYLIWCMAGDNITELLNMIKMVINQIVN